MPRVYCGEFYRSQSLLFKLWSGPGTFENGVGVAAKRKLQYMDKKPPIQKTYQVQRGYSADTGSWRREDS